MNKNRKVNVYIDINPITKKIFYVGIGTYSRVSNLKRNYFHQKLVSQLPNKFFIRKIIYEMIPLEKAWMIEKQIIKKCGRIIKKDGYLTNIHEGGKPKGREKYINLRKGKSYEEQYGEKSSEIIYKQVKNRMNSKKVRLQEIGNTKKELESFKKTSERQQGKTMRERLNDPNWVDPRKGKTAKEIYGDDYAGPPNKGKTYKELKGQDYIDPRGKPFTIQIDNESQIFCESERDFCIKFNCNDVLLRKFKTNGEYKIKRQKNSKHIFPNDSIVKLNYIT